MTSMSHAREQRRKVSFSCFAVFAFFAPLRLCVRPVLLFHEGQPHNWHDLARAWSFEPLVVISLTLSAILFAVGLRRLWRESSRRRSIRAWEALCFAGGWVALF